MNRPRQLRRILAIPALASLFLAQTACAATTANGPSTPAPGSAPAAASTSKPAAERFWYDGEHRRPLQVDPEWVVDFRNAKPDLEKRSERTDAKKSDELLAGVSPLFRDPNGEPRALPGGVVVRLRDADLADPRRALADAGLEPVRPIDPQQRVWLVAAPAGLESLALANRLYESGRFEAVTPNWWRPRALK